MERKRLWINSPADRYAVTVILVRNGYTVRQGRDNRPGSKTAKASYVEYWQEAPGE